mgnify:CR=1 FL=1
MKLAYKIHKDENNTWGFTLSTPSHITNGTMNLSVPESRTLDGTVNYTDINSEMSSSTIEKDIGFFYKHTPKNDMDFSFNFKTEYRKDISGVASNDGVDLAFNFVKKLNTNCKFLWMKNPKCYEKNDNSDEVLKNKPRNLEFISWSGGLALELFLQKKSINKILLNNLKKNSKWLTLNSILVQFYDLFDKYLVKIFLGPVALATYSIPQQLTGKLSILSKGFSAFLLPFLSKKNFSSSDFNTTLKIFLIFIPIIIFLFFPLFELFLKLWLGNQFNNHILELTKIFSLSVIFSCASHILVTKFEATQTLKHNLKFEFSLMPFFLILLFYCIL